MGTVTGLRRAVLLWTWFWVKVRAYLTFFLSLSVPSYSRLLFNRLLVLFRWFKILRSPPHIGNVDLRCVTPLSAILHLWSDVLWRSVNESLVLDGLTTAWIKGVKNCSAFHVNYRYCLLLQLQRTLSHKYFVNWPIINFPGSKLRMRVVKKSGGDLWVNLLQVQSYQY